MDSFPDVAIDSCLSTWGPSQGNACERWESQVGLFISLDVLKGTQLKSLYYDNDLIKYWLRYWTLPCLLRDGLNYDCLKTTKWFVIEIVGFLRMRKFKTIIFLHFLWLLFLYYQWLFLIIIGGITTSTYLLGNRYCDKCFLYIISFNPCKILSFIPTL